MNSSCSGSSRSNQLLSDGTYWYQYDPEGNRTARWIDVDQNGLLDSGDADITQYAWDNRNRLTEVSHFADFAALGENDPDSIVDYLYDAENRWIGRDLDSDGDGQIDHQTRFAYDGNQIVLQFDKDLVGNGQHGAANQLTVASLSHRYLWQPDAVDQLMADEQLLSSPEGGEGQGGNGRDKGYDLSQPGEVAWALSDQQGTIRDMAKFDATSGATAVVDHIMYDSFGKVVSESNPAKGCLFKYTGLPFDNGSGTYRTPTRPYDPSTGRWTQPDWINELGGQTNLYAYCGNSPTNATDPSGQSDISPVLDRPHTPELPVDLVGDVVGQHVRFETGEWCTWVPGISHLNNQNAWTRVRNWWNGAPLKSYIKVFPSANIVSNLYSGGNFCCNGMSGLGGGGVKCYVTNLPPGTYEVTYWYSISLRANGKASAGAMITEGKTTVFNKSVQGTAPLATFDGKLETRVVQVTVGATGEAVVFTYIPSATTPHGARLSDNATARGEFGVTSIKSISP